ncbi:MAG: xylulokinase [Balneolaceae bacterium]
MAHSKYLLGYDIGSSSIKASLVRIEDGKCIASAVSPKKELEIRSDQPGWAEQHPDVWWEHVKIVTGDLLKKSSAQKQDIEAIGISYQMHGLVIIDQDKRVLRPAIIWCDSRAVNIGKKAFKALGQEFCLKHFLNSPGNFTASKLKWIKENEPEIYNKIYKMMLPGDFIAMKMTGQINTTISGLSEGILWDYDQSKPAETLMNYYGIPMALLPEAADCFEIHGTLTSRASEELGLSMHTKVAYRAGDQPNNAFSLNVLQPGEAAATAGTSGVIYGVTDKPKFDRKSRVNSFVHVNHSKVQSRYGVLLCVNGTGIMNSWLKRTAGYDNSSFSYDRMNSLAAEALVGSAGLVVLPFGNGAERILENRDIGAHIYGLHFNRHNLSHLLRAGQEGIVFALNYGFGIMKEMGMDIRTVKAGQANMFLSPVFRKSFVNTTESILELYNTDGAQGAARGAGIGSGVFLNPEEAFEGLEVLDVLEPEPGLTASYKEAYNHWLSSLKSLINNE